MIYNLENINSFRHRFYNNSSEPHAAIARASLERDNVFLTAESTQEMIKGRDHAPFNLFLVCSSFTQVAGIFQDPSIGDIKVAYVVKRIFVLNSVEVSSKENILVLLCFFFYFATNKLR